MTAIVPARPSMGIVGNDGNDFSRKPYTAPPMAPLMALRPPPLELRRRCLTCEVRLARMGGRAGFDRIWMICAGCRVGAGKYFTTCAVGARLRLAIGPNTSTRRMYA